MKSSVKQDKLWREFTELSPELQQQVVDFIAFLRVRYAAQSSKAAKRPSLNKELFVGIWRDRKDLADSTSWVRQVRANEWKNDGG
ncbi:MAG: DUF2281 domain-containing protein [Anaerolineae bacterium]